MSGELDDLLEKAVLGGVEEARRFFEGVLESSVYVGLKGKAAESVALLGDGSFLLGSYMTVEDRGHKVLPVFSRQEFVKDWSKTDVPTSSVKFKVLVDSAPRDLWIYLNPCQEFGKEFSPWEIVQLGLGKEAIDEIVAEQEQDVGGELEIERQPGGHEKLKERLKSVFEVYSGVKEAFLIEIYQDNRGQGNLVLGLGLDVIEKDKEKLLFAELQQSLPKGTRIAKDLMLEGSPNFRLFADVTPFYIQQESVEDAVGKGDEGKTAG